MTNFIKEREERAFIIYASLWDEGDNTVNRCLQAVVRDTIKETERKVADEYHRAGYAKIKEGEKADEGFYYYMEAIDTVSKKYLPELFGLSDDLIKQAEEEAK